MLARAGWSVTVREAADVAGGGVRSGSLTLPGFMHDLGSAVHPLALASPFFRELPLSAHGLEWIQPPAPLAHPMADGSAVIVQCSIRRYGRRARVRGRTEYLALIRPFVEQWESLCDDILAPLPPHRFPAHPLLLAQFGLRALQPARRLARSTFSGERARALFAGIAAHSLLPLGALGSSAFGIVLGAAAHSVGWPIPRGGAGALSTALVSYLASLGGTVETDAPVESLSEVDGTDAILLDLTPRQILRIAGSALPEGVRRALARYRYGPGAFKIDWALSAPIPWRDPECATAATVHVGGTLAELVESEAAPWEGLHADRPFVLLVQPSLFDSSRAPEGRHTAWATAMCRTGRASIWCRGSNRRSSASHLDSARRRCLFVPDAIRTRGVQREPRGRRRGWRRESLTSGHLPADRLASPYQLGIPGVYICSSSRHPAAACMAWRAFIAAWRQ